MDEAQKQVFAIMPWMLMFLMAPFAAGLQLYWITSNVLTILQQRLLYARHPEMLAPAPATASKKKWPPHSTMKHWKRRASCLPGQSSS